MPPTATALGALLGTVLAATLIAVIWRYTGRNCPCGACPR